jgi:hypothetical protein
VYSPWDLISGALEFYDPPRRPDRSPDPKAVSNKSDPDARTLFLAHLEYWEGALIFDTLLDALDTGTTRVTEPAGALISID